MSVCAGDFSVLVCVVCVIYVAMSGDSGVCVLSLRCMTQCYVYLS